MNWIEEVIRIKEALHSRAVQPSLQPAGNSIFSWTSINSKRGCSSLTDSLHVNLTSTLNMPGVYSKTILYSSHLLQEQHIKYVQENTIDQQKFFKSLNCIQINILGIRRICTLITVMNE